MVHTKQQIGRLFAVVVTAGALSCGLATTHPAFAEQVADSASFDRVERPPRIAPIRSRPEGQTYGRWAAEWWQWALGVPADVNPGIDDNGEFCDQRQVGDVWFLAGTFPILGFPPEVERECTVPGGKSLFFPLINIGYFASLSDAPERRTEEFLREQARCPFPVELFVEIDGFEIRRATRFFTGARGSQSPFFNVQLPPGNILGADETVIPQLVFSPSAEEGYYLFVRPLAPGEHRIEWIAKGCTADGVVTQEITYNLTVDDD